jgi:predicted 3-demethylubiquinone-9 3-methyltransferase (glyoxalase superfamily)
MAIKSISPFLWFDHQAEEAANFYVSLFPDSKLGKVVRHSSGSPGRAGAVITVAFELLGQRYTAMNGGPRFKFTEAVSLVINCETQADIDNYWEKLCADGGAESQCGWLQDKYGLSWQVVPAGLAELLSNPDPEIAARTMNALLGMKKLIIADLKKAAEG